MKALWKKYESPYNIRILREGDHVIVEEEKPFILFCSEAYFHSFLFLRCDSKYVLNSISIFVLFLLPSILFYWYMIFSPTNSIQFDSTHVILTRFLHAIKVGKERNKTFFLLLSLLFWKWKIELTRLWLLCPWSSSPFHFRI